MLWPDLFRRKENPRKVSFNFDSFSDGQIGSKLWLCEQLENCYKPGNQNLPTIWIYGAWYGLLPFLILSRQRLMIGRIVLIEIDSQALAVSKKILNHWECQGQPQLNFVLEDGNMITRPEVLGESRWPDIAINTSTEHFTNWNWWDHLPQGTSFALQSTDMDHVEHISKVTNLDELKNSAGNPNQIWYEGTKTFSYPNMCFNRFMLIGKK